LQPGLIVILLPYFIIKTQITNNTITFSIFKYTGILLFLIGLILLIYCIYNFIVDGLGTLSPADPTKKLVVKGLYSYTRNPMYLGVILILLGESSFFTQQHF